MGLARQNLSSRFPTKHLVVARVSVLPNINDSGTQSELGLGLLTELDPCCQIKVKNKGVDNKYSKICLKWPLKKQTKNWFSILIIA